MTIRAGVVCATGPHSIRCTYTPLDRHPRRTVAVVRGVQATRHDDAGESLCHRTKEPASALAGRRVTSAAGGAAEPDTRIRFAGRLDDAVKGRQATGGSLGERNKRRRGRARPERASCPARLVLPQSRVGASLSSWEGAVSGTQSWGRPPGLEQEDRQQDVHPRLQELALPVLEDGPDELAGAQVGQPVDEGPAVLSLLGVVDAEARGGLADQADRENAEHDQRQVVLVQEAPHRKTPHEARLLTNTDGGASIAPPSGISAEVGGPARWPRCRRGCRPAR